jgi:hypothetical protein
MACMSYQPERRPDAFDLLRSMKWHKAGIVPSPNLGPKLTSSAHATSSAPPSMSKESRSIDSTISLKEAPFTGLVGLTVVKDGYRLVKDNAKELAGRKLDNQGHATPASSAGIAMPVRGTSATKQFVLDDGTGYLPTAKQKKIERWVGAENRTRSRTTHSFLLRLVLCHKPCIF